MNAIANLLEEAIDEKMRLIDFLRKENARLMKVNVEQINRIETLEARVKELEGDYLGGEEGGEINDAL